MADNITGTLGDDVQMAGVGKHINQQFLLQQEVASHLQELKYDFKQMRRDVDSIVSKMEWQQQHHASMTQSTSRLWMGLALVALVVIAAIVIGDRQIGFLMERTMDMERQIEVLTSQVQQIRSTMGQ
jgi:hypothetical protein